MSLLRRALNVFRSHRVNDDLDDELRFHLEATIDQLVAEGLTVEAATLAARRRLGNRTSLRERSRDVKLLPWLEAVVRDVGFGVRMLRKNATATFAVVVSLGLAMGACTAAFMLVDALVFRELPVREPGRLIYLAMPPTSPSQTREGSSFSYPLFERFQAASAGRVELVVAGYQARRRAVFHDAPDREDRLYPQHVSGNFFSTLGIVPAHGRVLTAADDRREAPARVAVLSHAFWKRRFGGDPSVARPGLHARTRVPVPDRRRGARGLHRRGARRADRRLDSGDDQSPRRAHQPGPALVPHVGPARAGSHGRGSPATPAAGHDAVSPRARGDVSRRRSRRRARAIHQPATGRPLGRTRPVVSAARVRASAVGDGRHRVAGAAAGLFQRRQSVAGASRRSRPRDGAPPLHRRWPSSPDPAAPARKRTAGGRGMCAWRGHRAAGGARPSCGGWARRRSRSTWTFTSTAVWLVFWCCWG